MEGRVHILTMTLSTKCKNGPETQMLAGFTLFC